MAHLADRDVLSASRHREIGLMFKQIKDVMGDARYWIAALLISFVYTIGPEIYRRAAEPRASFSTLDEIAAAVIRNLPKTATQSTPSDDIEKCQFPSSSSSTPALTRY